MQCILSELPLVQVSCEEEIFQVWTNLCLVSAEGEERRKLGDKFGSGCLYDPVFFSFFKYIVVSGSDVQYNHTDPDPKTI